jgi:hypothetical protein
MAHTHTFWVCSTAIDDGAILVVCRCGQFGTVDFDNHTEEEWRAAFHAPSRQYIWPDTHRVTLREQLEPETTQQYLCPAALQDPAE